MGPRHIDMTGEHHGLLTVQRFVGSRRRNAVWECVCDCGNVTALHGLGF